jgi:Zn-dependent alcohol dehydrogenase
MAAVVDPLDRPTLGLTRDHRSTWWFDHAGAALTRERGSQVLDARPDALVTREVLPCSARQCPYCSKKVLNVCHATANAAVFDAIRPGFVLCSGVASKRVSNAPRCVT